MSVAKSMIASMRSQIPSNNESYSVGEMNKHMTTTWILKNDSQECLSNIKTFCNEHNLDVKQEDPLHLRVSGSTEDINTAFRTKTYSISNEHNAAVHMPDIFSNVVDNILGLNTKKIAHTFNHRALTPNMSTVFTSPQVATLYNYPIGLDGTGQKIGIIELGGGYRMSDMTQYLTNLGIAGTPNITDISVDGAVNNPSDRSGANLEVVLDIQVIMPIVIKAAIFVYFAPNTDQGFYNAIRQAIETCNIISISWGAPEEEWNPATLISFNNLFQYAATKNVTIFAASGDNGSSDGLPGTHVDYPASSPYVIGCGGTTLRSSNGLTISQEVTWNGSGGGLSNVFSMQNYQSTVTYPLNNKRGVADVSGDGDPNTGYKLYSAEYGGTIVVAGTSAVSPLWSALTARLNQSLGHPVGFLLPVLYNNNVCRDVTQGSNGAYNAGINWDPCTGLGSPNGQLLLNVLQNVLTASFTATPLSGVLPLTVSFISQSLGSPTSYLYNFGDSKTGTQPSMTHTYLTAGTYTVTLTVTNANGSNTQTRTNYITVTNPPVLPVAAFTGSALTGMAPLTVSFISQSLGSPTSYLYNFGDLQTGTQPNMTHTYTTAGTYTVTLTVTNTNGFNTITKTNYIIVTNPAVLPVAAFTGSPLTGIAPLTVSFTSQSTGAPISYLYNFGDLQTGTQPNMTHVYSTTGTYTVTLKVTNANGFNTITKTNYITVSNPPVLPVAAFTGTPLSGIVSLTVSFASQSTGSPKTYFYNFGDSKTGTQPNMTHTYTTAGTYTVNLTVTNNNGFNTLKRTNYITVTTPHYAPVSAFTVTPQTGRNTLVVHFTDQSLNTPTRYAWSFGDNTYSSGKNPVHMYNRVGMFTVSLTTTNAYGSHTLTKTNCVVVTN